MCYTFYMNTCPSEDVEETLLHEYCEAKGLTNWHVPQETYTTSWQQKRKNKLKGVLEGVSDHWIILPTARWGVILLVIELKRQHGNTPTDAQIKFIHDIDKVDNIAAFCAYGADEAIKVIEELQCGVTHTLERCEERLEKIFENRQKKTKKRHNRENFHPLKITCRIR